MISKYSHKQLVWIDLQNPTNEEIVHILEEYEIPEYIKNMDSPFCVSDDFIISFHDEPTTVLGQFFKEIELSIVSNDKLIIDNNRLLFTYLLKSLYVNSERQLIINESMVKNYQKNIIKINKKNMTLKVLSFILLGAIILISILCL